jgi:hypothetical protein
MELYKLEIVLDEYFEGQTSIKGEKDLEQYLASAYVACYLKKYRSLLLVS